MSEISVFISYSHDSGAHKQRVLGLSERLRDDGVETILDSYVNGSPIEGWPRWMMNGLDTSTYVVCVCTEIYYRRFRGLETEESGFGVDWEGAIITQAIYEAKSKSHKFIPLLFDSTDNAQIPEPLRGKTHHLINSEANYQAFYDDLLDQSGIEPGEIGELKRKQRKTAQAINFDAPVSSNPTPADSNQENTQIPWYSFALTRQNNIVKAEDDNGKTIEIALSDLPDTSTPDQLPEQLSLWLFNNQAIQFDTPGRIRIMTDDPQLAMLPWQQLTNPVSGSALMDSGWIIETGPMQGRSYKHEFAPLTLHTPLLAIPAEHTHHIAGNRHFAVVQNYLEAYLDIHGSIPRAKQAQQLQRELEFHKPDLLYLYARVDGEHIILDTDKTGDRFTLQTLGEWIQQADIRPVVILSLIGAGLKRYPQTLVNNVKLLWVQTTTRDIRLDNLQQNLARVMQLSTKDPDLAALILQHDQHIPGMQSWLWLNGLSPHLNLNASSQQQQQRIRAALLKVMLGRTALKDQIAGGISRHLGQQTQLISYVVSGQGSACAHDVPEQIKQRLQWDTPQNSLPVIAYYLHIHLPSSDDIYNKLDLAISDGLACTPDNAEDILRHELERRGLNQQACCISLNWLFQVEHQAGQSISSWLPQWGDLVSEYFSNVSLEQCILVNAVCLQVEDEANAQTIQDAANRVLRDLRSQQIQPLIYRDALGKLDSDEIEDFLDNDQHYWHQELKLQHFGINSLHFANWVISETAGQFEETVQLIWRQYQRDYQNYLSA